MGFTPRSNHSYHGSTYYVGFYPEDLIYFTYKDAVPSGELSSGCTDTSAQCSSCLIKLLSHPVMYKYHSIKQIQATYIHTYIHTYIRTNIHTYKHTYIQSFTYVYIHSYLHATCTQIIHKYNIDHHVSCFNTSKRSHPQCIWSRDVSINHIFHKKRVIPSVSGPEMSPSITYFTKKESSPVYLVQRCLYHSYKNESSPVYLVQTCL